MNESILSHCLYSVSPRWQVQVNFFDVELPLADTISSLNKETRNFTVNPVLVLQDAAQEILGGKQLQ